MTVQAQNALLKTLEEPPEYGVIILMTSSLEALLPTIQSRCVLLNMHPVRDELVQKYLMEQLQIPDYKANVCGFCKREYRTSQAAGIERGLSTR